MRAVGILVIYDGEDVNIVKKGGQYFAIYYGRQGHPDSRDQHHYDEAETLIGLGSQAVAKIAQLVASDSPAEIGKWFVMMVGLKGVRELQYEGFRYGIESTNRILDALQLELPSANSITPLLNVPLESAFSQHSVNRTSALFEWAQEGDLFAAIYERKKNKVPRLSFEERLIIAKQLIKLIASLHRVGWVHRDINLSNVLLLRDANGNRSIKLTDFGFASKTDAIGPTQWAKGTPDYVDGYTMLEIKQAHPKFGDAAGNLKNIFDSADAALRLKKETYQSLDTYALGMVLLELTGTGPDDEAWQGYAIPKPLSISMYHSRTHAARPTKVGLSRNLLCSAAHYNSVDQPLTDAQKSQWIALKELAVSMVRERKERPTMLIVSRKLDEIDQMTAQTQADTTPTTSMTYRP